jgi:phosphotransferase system HPr (HPr) family protein
MLTLTREDVRLGCRAADWRAALARAAEALVQAGRVSAEYADLAAQGAEHRALLERLDGLLARGEGEGLAGLPADQLLSRLSGESARAETARVRLLNAHGLHARPAKELVQVARRQSVPICVRLLEGDGEAVSAASMTSILSLGARRGQTLVFSAEGEGAARAVSELVDAVRGGLGEPVTPLEEARAQASPRVVVKAPVVDLTQYTLAIDRGHPQLSAQSDAIHPAVLRLIQLTVEAAHAEGRWVGVCGELGSDPLAIPVLVGLGVDELSVSARRVPLVKARVRELTLPRARELAELALRQPTAAAVHEALEAV